MLEILDEKWLLFAKVVELGSLTRTSVSVGAPVSAISRQINLLEQQCKGRLFRRTGRGVVLTEFGSQIYPRIRSLLSQADRLSGDISALGSIPLGAVRVGILPSFVAPLAGLLVKSAAQRFPRIHLHLTEGSSVQLEEWLDQGRLDMSLLLREDEQPSAAVVRIMDLSLAVLGPRGDPLLTPGSIEFSALSDLPLILPSEPHLLRARLDTLAKARRMTLNVVAEADSINLQNALVAAGVGYAVIATPIPRLATALAGLSAAAIVNPELGRQIVLGETILRPQTLATRSIAQLLVELMQTLFRVETTRRRL